MVGPDVDGPDVDRDDLLQLLVPALFPEPRNERMMQHTLIR
jgi:hypothetical protein